MKKFLLFFLICTLSFGICDAQFYAHIRLHVISITKSDPHTNPESGDVDATIDNNEIIITAEEEVGEIDIVIEGEDGIEYEEEYDLSEGDSVVIDIEELPEGDYTLYIIEDDVVLVGEFEVE